MREGVSIAHMRSADWCGRARRDLEEELGALLWGSALIACQQEKETKQQCKTYTKKKKQFKLLSTMKVLEGS